MIVTSVYLPEDLHAWIKATAASERRSMTGQVVHLLEQARGQQPATNRRGRRGRTAGGGEQSA